MSQEERRLWALLVRASQRQAVEIGCGDMKACVAAIGVEEKVRERLEAMGVDWRALFADTLDEFTVLFDASKGAAP